MNDEYVFFEMESELNESSSKVLVDNIDMMPVHVKCRLKRAYEGLSRAQLAGILGCNTVNVSEFEGGKKCLPSKYHISLEKYLFHTKYRLETMGSLNFMITTGTIK